MSEQLVIHKESHPRSVLKAFSWRVVATATIPFVITGEVETALIIGGIDFVLKIFVYYLHERLWQLVPRDAFRRKRSAAATS